MAAITMVSNRCGCGCAFFVLKGRKMNAMFTDIHGAADFIGPGAIEVPLYQTEITDLVQRRGMFGRGIEQGPATGHPSRYFVERSSPAASATAGFCCSRHDALAPV